MCRLCCEYPLLAKTWLRPVPTRQHRQHSTCVGDPRLQQYPPKDGATRESPGANLPLCHRNCRTTVSFAASARFHAIDNRSSIDFNRPRYSRMLYSAIMTLLHSFETQKRMSAHCSQSTRPSPREELQGAAQCSLGLVRANPWQAGLTP